MIVRTACLQGHVEPRNIERFDAFIRTQIVPLMKQFPGVRSVRVMRALRTEDGGPHIHMTFESIYDSQDAMTLALAHPVRQQLKQRMAEILPLFTGHLFHITQRLIADEQVDV